MGLVSSKHARTASFARRACWEASPIATVSILGLAVFGALATAAQLGLLAELVSSIEQDDREWSSRITYLLVLFALALAAVGVVGAATRELRTLLVERVSLRTTEQLLAFVGAQPFEEIESADFHDRLQRARAGSDLRLFQLVWGSISVFASVVQLTAIGMVLFLLAPAVLFIALLTGVPLVLAARTNTRALYRYAFDLTGDDRRRGWLERILLDRRAGVELEVTGARRPLMERVADLSRAREALTTALVRRRLVVSALSSLVSAVVAAVAIAFLLNMVFTGSLSLSNAAVAVIALQQVRSRATNLASGLNDLGESAVFANDITSFLGNEVVQPAETKIRVAPNERLALEDVSYTYTVPGAVPAVRGVSMAIERGETLAIVGENGSGKTTLAKLLAGLYEPNEGALLVDERKLEENETVHVGAVFQEFNRYDLSVAENISIGSSEGGRDDEAIVAAAKAAGIHEVIDRLPDRYETILAREYTGGTEFSGGQWQRIAVARAFYAAAPVLILDEPSAALDARSEKALFEVVARHTDDRFTVIISHRFSTVRTADRIAVMHGGELEEIGTHEELMAKNGRYRDLFTIQAGPYLDI